MPTRQLLIKGKVQAVFYRATAKKVADKLNVTGWIRNTVDGNVEAMISGNEEQLEMFTQWCRTGPERSNVTEVIIAEQEEEAFSFFLVKH